MESKLFWIYLLDSCDQVGVWEENVELSNRIIGYEYSMDTLLKDFGNQIHIFKDNRKWWIVDFCSFQYGVLKEDSASKPIQSHVSLLKKHQLWNLYTKGIHTLKVKVKDKEEDKDKDKEPAYKKFYRDEWESSKGDPLEFKYKHIIMYLMNMNENIINESGEHILKVKKQLSFADFVKLHNYCDKRATTIKEMVDSWLNKPSYSTGKVSVYAVLRTWAGKSPMRGTNLHIDKEPIIETKIGKT